MDQGATSRRERGALVVATLGIVALVVGQAPGRIVPETKLEVALDPIGFLGRALDAWDPSAGFGRVQNQAVGYLFPMGPATALGQALGLPPWLVQRAWIAAVVVASLWGAHRLARAVGVSSAGGRVVAALAYALAPATLAVTAFQSAGQLPYALVPWVLVPLVAHRDGDDPRRTAARSTLWLVAMGGVNAASIVAVLPLVAVWFATRAPGRARRRLLAWWSAGAVAASLWWLIPLAVSVGHGVRFTDYTESAAITTGTESATEVLRGTGNWLSFLTTDGGLWLPGGWLLSSSALAVAATAALAAGGLWGLARRDAPGRAWLLPALALGAVAMGVGYAGAWSGPLSGPARDLLDGPLAPLRNVHKAAAVVRLPLALGLGHAVGVGGAALARRLAARDRGRPRLAPAGVAVAGAALVVAAIAPAAGGDLAAPGSFEGIPAAWERAAAWIDDQPGEQRALLVPGSAFAEYGWGRPLDEPIALFASEPWAVRDLIPLGGNGSTRLLDGVDRSLARGALPPGFATALARGGVGWLVVRNDLDRVRTGGPSPAAVRRLLATDPDIELVASFGPLVDDVDDPGRLSPRPGASATEAFRSLDVYAVPGATDRATTYPAAGALVVSGGPEGLLELPPELTEGRATVLAVDDPPAALTDPVPVATDTARRRDVAFGEIRDDATWTLGPTEPSPRTGEDPVDRWPADEPVGLTVARLEGAAALDDSTPTGAFRQPEWLPFAAFDGDPRTAWVPTRPAVDQWLEVRWDDPRTLGPVAIQVAPGDVQAITDVRISTDAGEATAPVDADGIARLPAPDAPTRVLRVEVAGVEGSRTGVPAGIAEVRAEGLDLHRELVLPDPSPDGAEVAVASRTRRDPYDLGRFDEEGVLDRRLRWAGGPAALSGTATAVPGEALAALIAEVAGTADAPPEAVAVDASSTLEDLPAFGADAALDGDPATIWASGADDDRPTLALRWAGEAMIDHLQLEALRAGGATVTVDLGEGPVEVVPDGDGRIEVPPTATEELTIAFDAPGTPVTVGEVQVDALAGRAVAGPDPGREVALGCGEGPAVLVDGTEVATRAVGTVRDLIDLAPLAWEACEPVALDAGAHRLTGPIGALRVDTAVLTPPDGLEPAPAARTVEIGGWGTQARTVEVGGGDAAVLATTENANDGWTARLDGEELEAVRIDGWRQGWMVPAGDGGTVELRYGPATTQRAGLAIGALALLALVAAALLRPRHRDEDAASAEPRPLGERLPPLPLAAGGAALVGLALAGIAGLVAGLAVALVPPLRRWAPWIAAASALAAGAVALIGAPAGVGSGAGTFSGPAQLLAAVALASATAALAGSDEGISRPAGSTPSTPAPDDRRGP